MILCLAAPNRTCGAAGFEPQATHRPEPHQTFAELTVAEPHPNREVRGSNREPQRKKQPENR
eukprot:14660460-Alexandrium_andersonii.AAC.1